MDRDRQTFIARSDGETEEWCEAAGTACEWRGIKGGDWLMPIVCMIFRHSFELLNY